MNFTHKTTFSGKGFQTFSIFKNNDQLDNYDRK